MPARLAVLRSHLSSRRRLKILATAPRALRPLGHTETNKDEEASGQSNPPLLETTP